MSTDSRQAGGPPIITLLSDFGTADHYVAALKGVILSIAPRAQLIDVTHEIAPQNVVAGAFVLSQSLGWFPPGSLHLAIVDPGVGSARRILAGRWAGRIVVAPDNGLIWFLNRRYPSAEIHELINRSYALDRISDTFHGRDIMAPAVAHLANGLPLASLGPRIEETAALDLPQPTCSRRQVVGEIVHIDGFGNLITNIGADLLRDLTPAAVRVGSTSVGTLQRRYCDAGHGEPLALIGSAGCLEIAVNQGSAKAKLQAAVGTQVVVDAHSDSA